MSPDYGDRAIEIGAVRISRGEITDEFQALMNPGFRVNGFIEDLRALIMICWLTLQVARR